MAKGNIFQSLPTDLSDEVFETIFEKVGVKIERIVSKGQVTPADYWYDQEQDEWVFIAKGQAKIRYYNGEEIVLIQGDYLTIPAHQKHQVSWTDPDNETIWLAVHINNKD